MRSTIRFLALALAALLVVGAAPALAVGTAETQARFAGETVGFTDDPIAVADRCPTGFQWILLNEGDGRLMTDGYAGDVHFTAEHCSRWLNLFFDGRIGAGLFTLTTPEGDELILSYTGYFRFEGDLATGWVSQVQLQYRIVDGSGVFEGAAGMGRMAITDMTGSETGRMVGALYFPG